MKTHNTNSTEASTLTSLIGPALSGESNSTHQGDLVQLQVLAELIDEYHLLITAQGNCGRRPGGWAKFLRSLKKKLKGKKQLLDVPKAEARLNEGCPGCERESYSLTLSHPEPEKLIELRDALKEEAPPQTVGEVVSDAVPCQLTVIAESFRAVMIQPAAVLSDHGIPMTDFRWERYREHDETLPPELMKHKLGWLRAQVLPSRQIVPHLPEIAEEIRYKCMYGEDEEGDEPSLWVPVVSFEERPAYSTPSYPYMNMLLEDLNETYRNYYAAN